MNTRTLVSFDWAAKKLLRQKVNFDILEGFLSETLHEDVTVKSILESQSNKNEADDKYNQVDVLCENTQNELIFIEIQFFDEIDYFQRLNYAVSKVVTEYMYSGNDYTKVKKVYSINILYYDLGRGEDYIYHGRMEFRGIYKNDVLSLSPGQQKEFNKRYPSEIFPEIILFKISKFDDIIRTPLDQWIYFFKHTELPEKYDAKGLNKVKSKLNLSKMDTATQRDYIDYLKNVRISQNAIESVRKESKIEGKIEGKLEGKLEGKIEVILALHEDGIPTAQIAKYTKLSQVEVERILNENRKK
jgi:predicted transposase/invertase (TIGR01784 family)